MKLVTSLAMRECDRRTIAGENLPAPTEGLVLMERAGWGIQTALRQHFSHLGLRPILIFCGSGNNGGDGLVVARLLHEQAYCPKVFLLADPGALSPDARVQYERYVMLGGRLETVLDEDGLAARVAAELRGTGCHPPLLVDALLGTGTRGAPRGLIGLCVSFINGLRVELDAEVLAVDLPTGVNADTGEIAGEAIEADLTVTMAYLKVGFLFYPARSVLGRVRVVDIGIPRSVEDDVGLPLNLMTREEAFLLQPQRPPGAHKSQVGRLLIIGGSPGLSGAPAMAAMAALRMGSGLVTVALPVGLNPALEAKLTEVMTLPCPESSSGCFAPEAEAAILARLATIDVWALGPGIGRDESCVKLVRRLLPRLPGSLVVDADGLFALSGQRWHRRDGAPPPVLTPHPGEMARLVGTDIATVVAAPCETAEKYAREHACVVVLKGAPTVTASPAGEVWINPTGNAGLATGGSGDVLTGLVAALLGQGLVPLDAARLAVFLHGWAADRALERRGVLGLTPSDLIEALPEAMLALGGVAPVAGSASWIHAGGFRIP
jgi:NAD(P)H-hydrate epimerase